MILEINKKLAALANLFGVLIFTVMLTTLVALQFDTQWALSFKDFMTQHRSDIYHTVMVFISCMFLISIVVYDFIQAKRRSPTKSFWQILKVSASEGYVRENPENIWPVYILPGSVDDFFCRFYGVT